MYIYPQSIPLCAAFFKLKFKLFHVILTTLKVCSITALTTFW